MINLSYLKTRRKETLIAYLLATKELIEYTEEYSTEKEYISKQRKEDLINDIREQELNNKTKEIENRRKEQKETRIEHYRTH